MYIHNGLIIKTYLTWGLSYRKKEKKFCASFIVRTKPNKSSNSI